MRQVANLRGRLVTRPGERGINAFVNHHAEFSTRFQREFAEIFVVRVGHIRKAQAEAFVIRSDQRIRALQIDVIAQDDQRPLVIIAVDPAGGVRQYHRADPHARQYAHRKNHFRKRIAFVKMHASLHDGNENFATTASQFADYQSTGMANRGRTGKIRYAGVRNSRRRDRSSAKSPRPLPSTMPMCGRSFVRARIYFAAALARRNSLPAALRPSPALALIRNIPTIDADIKFAIVPASIARMPNFASSPRLIRSQRADAADLNSNRTEIRKAAQRKRRDRKRARIERRLHRAERRKRHQFVDHHASSEQVADLRRIPATAPR